MQISEARVPHLPPLSPLGFPLFDLVVVNSLSQLLSHSQDNGLTQGVRIEETGDCITHAQFADDTSIVIEEKLEYVVKVLQNFHVVGEASGFFVRVEGIKAMLISW